MSSLNGAEAMRSPSFLVVESIDHITLHYSCIPCGCCSRTSWRIPVWKITSWVTRSSHPSAHRLRLVNHASSIRSHHTSSNEIILPSALNPCVIIQLLSIEFPSNLSSSCYCDFKIAQRHWTRPFLHNNVIIGLHCWFTLPSKRFTHGKR